MFVAALAAAVACALANVLAEGVAPNGSDDCDPGADAGRCPWLTGTLAGAIGATGGGCDPAGGARGTSGCGVGLKRGAPPCEAQTDCTPTPRVVMSGFAVDGDCDAAARRCSALGNLGSSGPGDPAVGGSAATVACAGCVGETPCIGGGAVPGAERADEAPWVDGGAVAGAART